MPLLRPSPPLRLLAPIQVTVTGTIEYNQITQAPLNAGHAGNPASLTFLVDSADFQNSASYPVRGYVINPESFVFTVNGASVGLNPNSPGPHYFVIRNNDPAVDGFYLSDEVDWPVGCELNAAHPSLGNFVEQFTVTYDGSTLASLDIAGAVGTYGYDGISSFYWAVSAGQFDPMGMIFEQIEITPVGAACAADLNSDSVVDGTDLGLLLGNWGNAGTGDLNSDGIVDGTDLGLLLGAWGNCA
ncbi:MAG: hypothetical protein U0636_06495 [Phycisphaerales bacterium]